MAKIGLPKGSGKWLKVREKSVKSQGILKWILSGNPDWICQHGHLTLFLLVETCGLLIDNLCKQFGPRSGQTECGS